MKWYYWRPVMAQLATLEQVKTQWTIDDLYDAHELLDLKEQAEAAQAERARRG